MDLQSNPGLGFNVTVQSGLQTDQTSGLTASYRGEKKGAESELLTLRLEHSRRGQSGDSASPYDPTPSKRESQLTVREPYWLDKHLTIQNGECVCGRGTEGGVSSFMNSV